jgi:hypothetical protein
VRRMDEADPLFPQARRLMALMERVHMRSMENRAYLRDLSL